MANENIVEINYTPNQIPLYRKYAKRAFPAVWTGKRSGVNNKIISLQELECALSIHDCCGYYLDINGLAALQYMKFISESIKITYIPMYPGTENLLTAYETLVATLEERTIQSNQQRKIIHEYNKEIINDISLLKPALLMILVNIDRRYELLGGEKEDACAKELKELTASLESFNQGLIMPMGKSGDSWSNWNRDRKNPALRGILRFYREMARINQKLAQYDSPYKTPQIATMYDYAMYVISTSSCYASYLSPTERQILKKTRTPRN